MKNRVICAVFIMLLFYSCDLAPMHQENNQSTDRQLLNNGTELFYSDYPHAFVSTDTNEPALINGVNIKRGPHRKSGGQWETTYINQEITALGQPDAPGFNAIRINMDWPYFQNSDGSFRMDAFDQLDILIDNAITQNIYVILNPIHVRNPGGACNEDPVMAGARWNIPAWAWEAVNAPDNPQGSCSGTSETSALMPDVLALWRTSDYLKYIVDRYDASTARGRQVIAVNLVSEPHGTGNTGPDHFEDILPVYETWLAPVGGQSVRAHNPDKILILGPARGDVSLEGVDLSGLQVPNFVFSFHDYFGRATGSSSYGFGYSGSGFASAQERTYQSSPTPYNPATLSYADRRDEHTIYVQQYLDWLDDFELPLYMGEYGILNPCEGGHTEYSARYSADTYHIYNNLYVMSGGHGEPILLPRTWWAHGYWDGNAIWYRSGSCQGTGPNEYFPYAYELTGELNLLSNPGFESNFKNWSTSGTVTVTNIGNDPANIHSGAQSAASWSSGPYTASLKSLVSNTPSGTYTATVWSRAGGSFNERKLQVYVNGSLEDEMALPISSNWTAYSINNISVPSGAAVTVGISLDANAGAWTQFDDFELREQ